MTCSFIKHPMIITAFVNCYLLPDLLTITRCWSWLVSRLCYIWIVEMDICQ